MIINVKNISKSFNGIKVIEDANIVFNENKIYGLIGKNGSGKSVFLKMLCGFYEPNKGDIYFDENNIVKKREFAIDTRSLIEKPSFLAEMTGYENLKILADIQKKIGDEEIFKSLEIVNLKDEANKKYHKYSLGMKQKLGIAQVIMENPKVMIFDEPFNGIEDATAEKLRKFLIDIKKDKIIIIATHMREDIENLADEIYKFDDGNIKKVQS